MTEQEKMICDAIKGAIATSKPRTTMLALAPKVGLTYDKLNNIVNGRTKPTDDVIAKIRDELHLPGTWPYETLRTDGAKPGERVSVAGTALYPIRVTGAASAGAGLWNVDVERRKVYVPERLAQIGTDAYIVDGDSMMPMLQEHDVAVLKPRHSPRHGYVFLFKMADGSYRLKATVFDRGDWYLASMNRRYKPELVPPGAQIVGMMVGFYSIQGTRERMELDPDGLRITPGENAWSAIFSES